MSHVTYTSTAAYPMPVGWKCSRCGRINVTICNIRHSASESRQGTFHSRKVVKEVEGRLAEQAKSQLAAEVCAVISNAERNQYGSELRACWCSGCTYSEPWATVRDNGCLVAACFMGALVCGFFALLGVLSKDWSLMAQLLGVAAALAGVAILSIKLSANKSKKMAAIFANLKDIERPVIGLNADDLREKMYGVIAQNLSDVDAIDRAVRKEFARNRAE